MCFPMCLIVSTAEVAVIEKFGKFTRVGHPGLNILCYPFEEQVGRVSFRVQQLNVQIEAKTLDNVFITAVVSVQYQVLRDKIFEAFYSLSNPREQITAHVYDVMRTQLPTLELDAVFEAKEDLAIAVKSALTETMTSYGFQIVNCLITDLDPDQSVKNAMNEINSSKRLKYAVAERAEGAKILQVKAAEAEAEAKYLSGVGVAKQRKAIVDGLRTSIVDFSETVSGTSPKEVMDLLLLTQYFDMIRDVGSANHCVTTFVPSPHSTGTGGGGGGSNGMSSDQMRNALLQTANYTPAVKRTTGHGPGGMADAFAKVNTSR